MDDLPGVKGSPEREAAVVKFGTLAVGAMMTWHRRPDGTLTVFAELEGEGRVEFRDAGDLALNGRNEVFMRPTATRHAPRT